MHLRLPFNQLEQYILVVKEPKTSAEYVYKALEKYPFEMRREEERLMLCRYIFEEDNEENLQEFSLSQT